MLDFNSRITTDSGQFRVLHENKRDFQKIIKIPYLSLVKQYNLWQLATSQIHIEEESEFNSYTYCFLEHFEKAVHHSWFIVHAL